MDAELPKVEDVAIRLRGEWADIQATLPSLVTSFPQADDPMVLDHINAFRDRLDAMTRIHKDLFANNHPGLVQQQYNPFAQQSG
jgi:hypothetical protein